jgi:hypothetical protein
MRKTTTLKSAFLGDARAERIVRLHEKGELLAVEELSEGLWASGLAISASIGLPNRNEASWADSLFHPKLTHDLARLGRGGSNGRGRASSGRR